jgi:hypothetical protein
VKGSMCIPTADWLSGILATAIFGRADTQTDSYPDSALLAQPAALDDCKEGSEAYDKFEVDKSDKSERCGETPSDHFNIAWRV